MAHPVLDNSKTWTWLLEHKPKDLRDFISQHPQQFELERVVRKFVERTTGAVNDSIGNTNFKNQVKIVLAFWRGMENWREAYRYTVGIIEPDKDSRLYEDYVKDWHSFYLKIDREMNDNVLEHDRDKQLTAACPLFD